MWAARSPCRRGGNFIDLESYYFDHLKLVSAIQRANSIKRDAAVLQRQLSVSVSTGELSQKRAIGTARWVDTGVSYMTLVF